MMRRIWDWLRGIRPMYVSGWHRRCLLRLEQDERRMIGPYGRREVVNSPRSTQL